jgi:radical SAM superfamily enzyme YgiQ (UPF0313 family)
MESSARASASAGFWTPWKKEGIRRDCRASSRRTALPGAGALGGFPVRHFDGSARHVATYLDRGGMMNLETKRGCPYECLYCTYPHIDVESSAGGNRTRWQKRRGCSRNGEAAFSF